MKENMAFNSTKHRNVLMLRRELTSKKAEDDLVWEMCCNKNPRDADAYLNDPKSHPQTGFEKTKTARIEMFRPDSRRRNPLR